MAPTRPTAERGPSRPLAVVVAVAAAITILGASVLPLLTPAWISFEQGRAGSSALTGYPPREVDAVTQSIVSDLLFGGDFAVTSQLVPVLDDAEVAHMRDVRAAFRAFGLIALASLAVVAVSFLASRRQGESRHHWWRAVRAGAIGLAVVVAGLGIVALVAFDAAFEVFHQLFFASGTYSFDPATSKLVQLFPESFWSETTLVLGFIAVGLALLTATVAGRRATAGAGAATVASVTSATMAARTAR